MGVYGAHDSRFTNFRSYHLSSWRGLVLVLLQEWKWVVWVNLLPCELFCGAVKQYCAAAAISQTLSQ